MQMTGSHTNDFQRGSLKGKWVVMLMKTYFELQNLRCRLLRSSGRTLVSERERGPREVGAEAWPHTHCGVAVYPWQSLEAGPGLHSG